MRVRGKAACASSTSKGRDDGEKRWRGGARSAAQAPFAIVLGCSDARVPAELVFDQGLGDLFVIRVAGNIVAPSQVGSVGVRGRALRHAAGGGARATRSCGAILATLGGAATPEREPVAQPAARSWSASARRSRDCSTDRCDATLRNWSIAPCAPTSAASADHLRHGSEVLEQLIHEATACWWSARNTAVETGVVDFFDGLPAGLKPSSSVQALRRRRGQAALRTSPRASDPATAHPRLRSPATGTAPGTRTRQTPAASRASRRHHWLSGWRRSCSDAERARGDAGQ